MKVILLSNLYPKSKNNHYMKRSRCGLSAAADAHQYAIALGLSEVCNDFEIVNLPAVSHFPLRYKDPWLYSEYIEENGLRIHNVGYNNIPEYQFYSRCINARRTLDKIVKKTTSQVYIVVYEVNIAAIKAAVDIKHKYYNKVKLCNIIPDLPQDIKSKNKWKAGISSFFQRLYFKNIEDYFPEFDSFVLLTEFMREIVPCREDQYIVSEGIYEEAIIKRQIHRENRNNFILFYGGMLHERFGVRRLIDVFHSIDKPNMRLQLCGYGDCVSYVKELSKLDNRIEYLGILEREKVLELQSEASLLINPRVPDNNPFTRYSFPSKTMEYFASATPTLLYQLDGIPAEYYGYCYSLDPLHTDADSLKNKIIEIYNTPVEERIQMGLSARNFVVNHKNQTIAGNQILELLKRTL